MIHMKYQESSLWISSILCSWIYSSSVKERERVSAKETAHQTIFMIHVQFLVQISEKKPKKKTHFVEAMAQTNQSLPLPAPPPACPLHYWHTVKLLTYTPNWYAARGVNNQKAGKWTGGVG